MSIIQSADSIVALFGYKRVACAYCTHSIGTDAPLLLCDHTKQLVERDAQCPAFSREPGSDE